MVEKYQPGINSDIFAVFFLLEIHVSSVYVMEEIVLHDRFHRMLAKSVWKCLKNKSCTGHQKVKIRDIK